MQFNLKILYKAGFVFAIQFVLLFVPIVTIEGQTRTALVIGNAAYQSARLTNPVNDARDMAVVLKESGFDVMLKTDADHRTMDHSIREFGRKLRNGGAGLFYYAGHGLQVKGRNYLIPVEAQIESEGDIKFEAVDAGFVLSKMEDAGNDVNIVILDACRNNPFARSFRSSAQGLARMDAPKGTLIAYATAPGEMAADGHGRNGVYTKHLIQNIRRPGLKIEDILKNVRIAVVSETGNKQVPWESSSLMGQFYFARYQPQPPASLAIPKENNSLDNSREVLFWNAIKESQDPLMFEAYLQQYPDGIFVTLAQINMQKFDKTVLLNTNHTELEPDRISLPEKSGKKEIAVESLSVEKDNQIVKRNNRFIKYQNGIVYDTQTSLEWMQGPDQYMGGFTARKWVQKL